MIRKNRIEVEKEYVWWKNCNLVYFIANRFLLAGFGLGWDYLATEGIIPLARLTKS
jgi:hypothetical protein